MFYSHSIIFHPVFSDFQVSLWSEVRLLLHQVASEGIVLPSNVLSTDMLPPSWWLLKKSSISKANLVRLDIFSKIKVGLSPFKKKVFICFSDNPSKMMKNAFLFHLKSFSCSQDIWIFDLTFWACSKNGLIRDISLISKFMMTQPG